MRFPSNDLRFLAERKRANPEQEIHREPDDKKCDDARIPQRNRQWCGALAIGAVIVAAQKIEHNEIASYGSVRTWANMLGHERVADLLERTLQEEKDADRKLTALAESNVNVQARQHMRV